ncbi:MULTISPECIES: rod-binding protein [Methylobacterium]|jgi:flagellar protein FlgJ|uniref:Rod binding domain-containing protein n=1 Tax=Methylobacterium fujisawaense TaxID=107400 RepID=A0ABR6D4J4_9HYPH|nr:MULTISPECIES: rod-binding protein [Methylobacterium]KOX58872.1 flagellar rod assembly protein FlgJ [Streptomyces purpurogeneiscleroticus]MBA9060738.1 Rod binding domain-containing protein [Methylobacterium fujisawaense]MDE4910085.1 rod-binding protein [Methylobacterium sp. 092160098-2]MDH3029725.1 rod-binding protein [Methylobacterium fujisawaense]RUP16648.1 MAG: flagellar biosynthesis protein FlgJ [Methylobacterium sp.]
MLQLASLAANAAGIGTSVAGSAVDGVIKSASKAKAWKTATEFESMFLENSLDRLTQSDGTEGPLGENGTGGGVYRSMLTKEYATQIVKSGGVGIADSIFREIMKMQGAASDGATNAKG